MLRGRRTECAELERLLEALHSGHSAILVLRGGGQATAQETQIAELARQGHSNPEIGAQLFISPRSVEYHLHKVFVKLEISSRDELQRVLRTEAREAQPV
jgi:DNA-binding CsgD family transcriptional regulator